MHDPYHDKVIPIHQHTRQSIREDIDKHLKSGGTIRVIKGEKHSYDKHEDDTPYTPDDAA